MALESNNPFADPFCRPKMTFKSLQGKIDSLQSEVNLFSKRCKYETFEVVDYVEDVVSYRARLLDVITPELSHSFSEIMADMKHFLDQSVHASLMHTTGKDSTKIHFPTGLREINFKDEIKRRCFKEGLSEPVINIIENTQCFKDGDGTLYQMTVFARNKHRGFIGQKLALNGFGISNGTIGRMFEARIIEIEEDNCIEFARASIGDNNLQLSLYTDVVFTDPPWLADRSAIFETKNMFKKCQQIHYDIMAASFSVKA